MRTSPVRRLGQGLRALFAFAQPLDVAPAQPYLADDLLALLRRMKRSEQIHSLRVLRDLLAEGPVSGDLGTAALLHDVGKSHYPLAIWQKTAAVLVRAFLPRLFHRLSQGDPRRLLERPFVVAAQHPTWSAELAGAAGATGGAIWLIAHHQDDAELWSEHAHYAELLRLQRADDLN
ncbi:MAG: HD domain-containing protein [Anaerolineae bacterium]|nr:HD domain-containing protein [Anaerolineae bacterium]NUQ03720.1 HD domain-containing protein [Anaerolineae bacterium]